MKNQYEFLAQVYDELMYDAAYPAWADYLIQILEKNGVVKGSPLIEYACGTGNITVELARQGYRMTALDRSGEMLDIAAGKLRKNAMQANFVCADMASFLLPHKTDGAVCACDGVNYILDDKKLACFFSNVCSNLKKGGVFTFDVSSEYKLSQVLGDEFFYDDAEDQTLFWQNAYRADTRRIEMNITLFIAQDGVYQRFDECHTQRAWREAELKQALLTAGFERVECFAFGAWHPPEADSERIQLVAIR